MGTGPCFGDSGTSRSRRLRRLKSRRIASDPKESGLEHERTFLGLLKNGETEVGIPALAKTPSFRSNPFSERIFQLFATSEEANRMSLPEYKAAVKELMDDSSQRKVELAFRAYDVDGDGFVSQGDLCHWLRKLGGSHSPRQNTKQAQMVAKSTVEKYDEDGDGKLSLEEFKPLMCSYALSDHFGL